MAEAPTHRVVIGTAGHIDHGKTSLLQALTGVDCDRWAEEKARGITIDLGFTHLEADGLQVGFVDVPGHERFLHNALAGLGGIRIMLLVVAADEGVKPQTREHLAVCSLLGIPHGVVALTKRDLVDQDLLELAQLEVEELLEEGPFEGSDILPVSSVSGEGLEALRERLLGLARELASQSKAGEDSKLPFRLPVDRAFHLQGRGVIVTGTAVCGSAAVGDSLEALPSGGSTRVRGVQVHGQVRQRAEPGERTALQLAGLELESLDRGVQLGAQGAYRTTRSLLVRCSLLADAPEAWQGYVPIRFHLYSSEVVGKARPLPSAEGEVAGLDPGESGLVEIRLAAPVAAVRGDRFILRRPSPATTLGGGTVLDPSWLRRRGRSLVKALPQLEELSSALVLWVQEKRERGVTAAELAPRLGWPPSRVQTMLDELTQEQQLLRVDLSPPRWVAPLHCQRVLERGKRVLASFFAAERLADGMPKAEFLARVLPRRAQDLGTHYLQWMAAAKIAKVSEGLVTRPGRKAQLSDDESKLARELLRRIAEGGLTPPNPEHLDSELGAKRQIVAGVVQYLLRRGRLVRLPSGLLLASEAIEQLKTTLLESGLQEVEVAKFKELFGLSRKWAIPLLEHLDSTGFTRRVGDRRQIVGP